MPSRAEVIRTAQRGIELSRYFPTERRLRQPAITELDADQRALVIDVFTGLFEGLYAHLPLKRSMYGIDPVQRLRLLRLRVDQLDSLSFHYELAGIVTGLRDAHTRYVGPAELAGRAAMLPFLVEAYGPANAARYIVSKVLADPSLIEDCQSFQPGVEIRWWNAVPMDRAVDRHADQETGGRADTRRARALESMTLRALQYCPPPDERWVTVGYLDLAGKPAELRVNWRMVTARKPAQLAQPAAGAGDRARGIDPAAETHRQVKKLLFAPHQWYADRQPARSVPKRPAPKQPAAAGWLPTSMPDALAAKEKTVRGQRLGYLRLWSFDVADDQAYLDEVTRLLGLLPDRGLIIDLRSNPGGLIWAAERLLQLLTPNRVQPVRFSMLATSLTRAMAQAPQNVAELEPWRQSLQDALADGEAYSCATPISRLEGTFQVYGGPAVAIVDPNTYSAGDLFAAGFVDNAIGPLIGIGEATGAGGANVWLPQQVQDALLGTTFEQRQLPAGIGYTLSVRRATRAGPVDGAAIEDVGVRADRQYSMTKRDLTGSNEDLLAFAGRLVLQRRYSRLTVAGPAAAGEPLTVRTHGIDQLDVIVDGRHQPSRTAPVGSVRIELPSDWTEVEIQGRAGGELLQRRRLTAS